MLGVQRLAGWIGRRMVWALAFATMVVLGTVFRQNIENYSAAIETDNLIIDGAPSWLRVRLMEVYYLAAWMAGHLFGSFGVGLATGIVISAIPDMLRRLRDRRARSAANDGLLRDLQGFFEIRLQNACQALANAISLMPYQARLGRSRPGWSAVPYLTHEALHGRLLAVCQKTRSDLAVAVAAGSLNDAEEAVETCISVYRHTQQYLGALAADLSVDLDRIDGVAQWLEIDREFVMRLRELTASARLKTPGPFANGVEPASCIGGWRDHP